VESTVHGRVPERELEQSTTFQRHQIIAEQVAQTAALPEAAGLHRGELEGLTLAQAIKTRAIIDLAIAQLRQAQP
jgi:hypothetical protein